MQQFVGDGATRMIWPFSSAGVVDNTLGDEDAVLTLDGGDFPAGKIGRGQTAIPAEKWANGATAKPGVFLDYASDAGYHAVTKRLYMPVEWVQDAA